MATELVSFLSQILRPVRNRSLFRLSQCGHTFCGSCLEAWFRSATDQHKLKYPHWTPHIHIPYMQGPVNNAFIQQFLQAERQRNPPPTFHCPTCRVVVTRKPTEDFKLKELIHTIATARGEEDRRAPLPNHKDGQSGRGMLTALWLHLRGPIGLARSGRQLAERRTRPA